MGRFCFDRGASCVEPQQLQQDKSPRGVQTVAAAAAVAAVLSEPERLLMLMESGGEGDGEKVEGQLKLFPRA